MRVPSFLAFATTLILIGCSGGGGSQALTSGPSPVTPPDPNPNPAPAPPVLAGLSTPAPDPRPAPGPLGPSGNNRWQIGSPSGLYVVDPAAGELAVQGATAGSAPLIIVNLDKGIPPADTTVTLNGVQLIRWSGNPDFIWTLDPAGPQPVVGSGGFIELVATSGGGRQRTLVLPVPSDLTLTSTPAPGSSLGAATSVTLTFPVTLVLNPAGIPGLAGVYPEAFLLGFDPTTRTLASSSYGQALIGAGQLGVAVPVTASAATGQYLLDLRWPGLWQPDGEAGAFCGLAKRLNYSR
jgi:hypothetical protein